MDDKNQVNFDIFHTVSCLFLQKSIALTWLMYTRRDYYSFTRLSYKMVVCKVDPIRIVLGKPNLSPFEI